MDPRWLVHDLESFDVEDTMMGDRFNIERVERGSADPVLVALLVLIIGIGVATLFSASY